MKDETRLALLAVAAFIVGGYILWALIPQAIDRSIEGSRARLDAQIPQHDRAEIIARGAR